MTGRLIPLRRVDGTAEELSDLALVSALGQGDQAAMGALYDRFHGDLYRFIGRMTRGQSDEVDDLVQNTFIEVYRSARRFQGKSAVKTWLFGIATNLVRDHWRRQGRREKGMATLKMIPQVSPASPHEKAQQVEWRQQLDAAIAQLPTALRETYILCVVEEVPTKEAATILSVREASLYRRLHDARSRLRTTLEKVNS